jgi:hypothetical protein
VLQAGQPGAVEPLHRHGDGPVRLAGVLQCVDEVAVRAEQVLQLVLAAGDADGVTQCGFALLDPALHAERDADGVERAALLRRRPDGPGHVQRVAAQPQPLAGVPLADVGGGVHREHPRGGGRRWRVDEQVRGRRVRALRAAVVAGLPQVAAQPLVHRTGQGRLPHRVQFGHRGLGQFDSLPDAPGPAGGVCRRAEQPVLRHSGDLGGVRQPLPDLQCPLELAPGLPEREQPQRVVPGPHGRFQRLRVGLRRVPVVRQLGRDRQLFGVAQVAVPVERCRDRPVQAQPVTGNQRLVDHLTHECVPEHVGLVGRVGDQHLAGHALAQRGEHPVLGQVAHRLQQAVADPAAGRGRHTHHLLGVVAQEIEPW